MVAHGNDGSDRRYAVYRLGLTEVPTGYSTTLADAFGTGKPVASGNGMGQLGDRDPAGNPCWFYQAGMPGNQSLYRLLPYWDSSGIYTFNNPGGSYGWAITTASGGHPGPSEAASTIITYMSPYKPMKAAITCTAGTSGSSDGVLLRLYKNDTFLTSLDLPGTGSGTIGTNNISMVAGDCLHLAISMKTSQNNDATSLGITVTAVTEAKKGTVILIQ